MSKRYLLLILIIVFVIGAGLIIYFGRPIMQSNDSSTTTSSSDTSNPSNDAETGEDLSYDLSEVEAHSTQENCWTAINGNVYDLTTWVSRHPGGPDKIIGLCGKESTQAFEGMHGNSSNAQNALVLLKIGTLN